MNLELKRDVKQGSRRTFGQLYVEGVLECETLEDPVREIEGEAVMNWKVKGDTAIPRGRYRVIINRSQRFGRDLPLLLNVQGFDGVRIHSGNTEEDTEGCILVGTERSSLGVLGSRVAFSELFQDIRDALNGGEQVWITIT
jgi:hypothetical protein